MRRITIRRVCGIGSGHIGRFGEPLQLKGPLKSVTMYEDVYQREAPALKDQIGQWILRADRKEAINGFGLEII